MGKKKHMTGFTPIDFCLAGKVLLVVGLILLTFAGANCFNRWINNYSYMIILAPLLVITGIYIISVVPKEKE